MAVVDLAEHKLKKSPHVYGPAKCLACKHEWVQVAPAGDYLFPCPVCGTEKGTMKFAVWPEEAVAHCDCGCYLYFVTRQGPQCLQCGNPQDTSE